MYDDARVYTNTADSIAASNAIITPCRLHKVVLTGDGSNVVSLLIRDFGENSGAIAVSISMNEVFAGEFERYQQADFNPPLRFATGVSFDITGNAGTYYFYYSLA